MNNNKQKGRTKQHDKREKGKCNVCTKRVTTKRCNECNEFVCGDDVEEVCRKRNESHSDRKPPRKPKFQFCPNFKLKIDYFLYFIYGAKFQKIHGF